MYKTATLLIAPLLAIIAAFGLAGLLGPAVKSAMKPAATPAVQAPVLNASFSPAYAKPGQVVELKIEFTNGSPLTAEGLIVDTELPLTDVSPAGLEVKAGNCQQVAGDPYVVSCGDVPAGGSIVFVLKMVPNAGLGVERDIIIKTAGDWAGYIGGTLETASKLTIAGSK